MPRLFLTNIPYDCPDIELRQWIQARGFDVDSVRVIRDLVAGVSPAFGYVSLRGTGDEIDAIKVLDGQDLKGRRLQVREDWRDEHLCR
jgi:RNA recognition motif-containing protein